MGDRKKLIQVKLDVELVKAIDHYAVDRDIYRNAAVEELIRLGLAVDAAKGEA